MDTKVVAIVVEEYIQLNIQVMTTLPKTNMAPENSNHLKGKLFSKHQFSGAILSIFLASQHIGTCHG